MVAYFNFTSTAYSDYTYSPDDTNWYGYDPPDQPIHIYYSTQSSYPSDLVEKELKQQARLLHHEHIVELGMQAFYFRDNPVVQDVPRKLLLFRKMPRCNRHGIGLRMRLK